MEIQEIRRVRLGQLIRDHYESQADFVAKTGINQGEVSSLLRSKSFGEKKARKIERDCALPLGWLDNPGGLTAESTTEKNSNVEAPEQRPRPARLQWITDEESDLLSDFRQMAQNEQKLLKQAALALPKKASAGLIDHKL